MHDKRVLYYAFDIEGKGGSPPVPVFEFLSDSQNTPSITRALMVFLHSVGKVSNKIDIRRITFYFSWALIHSVLTSHSTEKSAKHLLLSMYAVTISLKLSEKKWQLL